MSAPSSHLSGDAAPSLRHSASAFDALVRAHYARLCSFVYRILHSETDAEDVVQGVFSRIWVRQLEFDYSDPLPYLYRAVRNAALTHLRDRRVRAQRLAAFEPPDADPVPGAAAGMEQSELAGAFRRAVAGLPPRCRTIYTMNREQGLTYAEIARVLGISVKTVETQMGRALRTLRTSLAPYLTLGLALLVAVNR